MTDRVSTQERNLVCQAVPVFSFAGKRLGFSACCFLVGIDRIEMLEFGQYGVAETADARIAEVKEFLKDWECVTGVVRTLDDAVATFAKGDALSGTWSALNLNMMRAFRKGEFSLVYAAEEFRPDLTVDDRVELRIHGCASLIGPQVQRISNTHLNKLSDKLGYPVLWDEAVAMANAQGGSILTPECWSVEVAPVIGDADEFIGYGVFGLAYGENRDWAQVWMLCGILPEEMDARLSMSSFRLIAEAKSRIPFDEVHWEGMGQYFQQTANENGGERKPFILEGVDLTLFLSWAAFQRRSSYDASGMLMTEVIARCAEDYADRDPAELARLRRNYGCEDVQG